MITGPNANHNNLWKSYDLSQFITPYTLWGKKNCAILFLQ